MTLPLRERWDVTHLAAKYPWLRIDEAALEEFRSPFYWVPDESTSVRSVVDSPGSSHSRDNGIQASDSRSRRRRRAAQARCRDADEGKAVLQTMSRVPNAKKPVRKKPTRTKSETQLRVIARNHTRLFPVGSPLTNNTPVMPPLQLPTTQPEPPGSASTSTQTPAQLVRHETMLESLQRDHEALVLRRYHGKKQRKVKPKRPTNVLALRFPVLTSKSLAASANNLDHSNTGVDVDTTPRTRLDIYTRQLASLTRQEQWLEQDVLARVAAEKARLPLTFLFERNLAQRADAQQDGLRTVTAIFAKLQHRLLFSGFTRWRSFLFHARHEQRQREGLQLAQKRAVALLERLASDAYVGTLAKGFERWKRVQRFLIEKERHQAAALIQAGVRARRARLHLRALRHAAQARDTRRTEAIEALLRFERYGTAMQWSTLRIGFDLVRQTRAARNLQFFLRRVRVRRRIEHRVLRREGAVRLQSQWRARLARLEVQRRRVERTQRQAIERRAAIQLQRHARGFLAKQEANRRRRWLALARQNARRLQRWIRGCWGRAELVERFNQRRRLIDEARARAAAEELDRLRRKAVVALQCVLRGIQARTRYRRKLLERRMDEATRFLQHFWRRRRGMHALGLRFAAQRERMAQRRWQAAEVLQCSFRCYCARQERSRRATERQRHYHAAVVLQRHVRGFYARQRFQRAREAALVIQCWLRCVLAKRLKTRRLKATRELQHWARGLLSCRMARRVLEELRLERERREASALLIQKRARQLEAQQMARLMRDAMAVVKAEQRRYFGGEGSKAGTGWATHQASSELLAFVTERFLENDRGEACFSLQEAQWLRAQVQAGYERLKREDQAAVFLQRHYRGFATRLAFWVHRCQMEQLRRLQNRKAVVLQRAARGWLARRHVRRKREERRLAELKAAYVRERRWKDQEREWKERYDREQMELRVQRAQETEKQLREARREAELARFKAEAAVYRAQELAAQRELDAMQPPTVEKGDGKPVDEPEKQKISDWVQLADEYGNVYYYNERTSESSWEPPQPEENSKLSLDTGDDSSTPEDAVPSTGETNTREKKPEDKISGNEGSDPGKGTAIPEAKPEVTLSEEDEKARVSREREQQELERAVRDGKCTRCRRERATKRCVDCENGKYALFCTACFAHEHLDLGTLGSALGNGSKSHHDFAVLTDAQTRVARCQSFLCCTAEVDETQPQPNALEKVQEKIAAVSPSNKELATYFCFDCSLSTLSQTTTMLECRVKPPSEAQTESKPTSESSTAKPEAPDVSTPVVMSPGCFYCDACFMRAHETAQELQHVEDALRFRPGALLCCDCGSTLAARRCEQCKDEFCAPCFASSHARSKRRSETHTWTPLEVLREPLANDTDVYCVECEIRASSRLCNLCGDGFCDSCFASAHAKGAKRGHTWLPWAVAAQHGDWLEIKDDKATVYFNVETKESTSKRPVVLLSGDERHRLQLAEREQLMRRRELELESEVVKLKEQLHELQNSRQPRRQRFGSRAKTPDEIEVVPEPPKSPEKTKKAKKPGLLSKLYPRRDARRRSQADKNLSPEERQRVALVEGIQEQEQELLLDKLTTRARATKQARERDTVGSLAFQQAILQELTTSTKQPK